MKRNATLINSLKQSVTDKKDSEFFGQNIYESSNFNVVIDTDYILSEFHVRSAYTNTEYQVKVSKFNKEELITKNDFGRHNSTEFHNTKLKWK